MDLSSHDSPLLPLRPCATCPDRLAARNLLICEGCAARIDAQLLDLEPIAREGRP